VSDLLAQGKVPVGKYTQIRIVVINVTGMMDDGTHVNFTVPSGELKTTHPFNVTKGSTTKLTLDIDLSKSIVQADGKWLFKPVLGAIVQG
jgi:3-deoxy-D-manno-octulosonate 8-phosphate phosphatase KdsC-like HAD superfamily phosphatase